jgi:hypothetical protein
MKAFEESLRERVLDGEGAAAPSENGSVPVSPGEDEDDRESELVELRGMMLSLNEQISDVGTNLIFVLAVLVALACLAIHLRWLGGGVGEALEGLRSVWFYLFLFLAGFTVFGVYTEFAAKRVFQRRKRKLYDAIDKSAVGRAELLAKIADDESVKDLAEQMRKDGEYLFG